MSPNPLSIRADQILAALADAYAFHLQRGAAAHYLDALAVNARLTLQMIGHPHAAREVAQTIGAIHA